MMEPKYLHVVVELVGHDGNAFAILSAVTTAMRRAGISQEEIDAYRVEATSGNYEHLHQTTMRWVVVTYEASLARTTRSNTV